jgi:DNA-directed RNA polymerase specialized sigma24 family protein
MALEQDQRISEVIKREQSRLRNFIRRRVPDPRDAEDILQEVFYELVEANRLLMPIEHLTGWLFRVARNRITDLFRKKEPENFSDTAVADFERRVIIERLEQCSWSQTEAAADLNVPLSTLNQKIKRLNIEVKRRRAGEGAEQG